MIDDRDKHYSWNYPLTFPTREQLEASLEGPILVSVSGWGWDYPPAPKPRVRLRADGTWWRVRSWSEHGVINGWLAIVAGPFSTAQEAIDHG